MFKYYSNRNAIPATYGADSFIPYASTPGGRAGGLFLRSHMHMYYTRKLVQTLCKEFRGRASGKKISRYNRA